MPQQRTVRCRQTSFYNNGFESKKVCTSNLLYDILSDCYENCRIMLTNNLQLKNGFEFFLTSA